MPRLRIVIIGDALDKQQAGVHIYLKKFLDTLNEVYSEHEIIVLRRSASKSFHNLKEINLKTPHFLGSQAYRMFFQIPNFIKDLKPHFVIEPSHFGPFNLSNPIKRITIIHDLTPLLFPKMHVWHSQILQRIFLPSIIRRADLIISNSKFTSSDIIKQFPFAKGKIQAVIPGRDLLFNQTENNSILEKYKLRKPYLLYLGTIEPRKNISLLINAFNKFKKEGFSHQLVIVGKKGWKFKSTLNTIENSPFRTNIILPGYIDREDLPAIYSLAEQFVYPSQYEGFGLPVLEAMACGVPVITTNISSLPEVGGDAALYFENNNIDSLFEKIKLLATNPDLRKDLSEKGIEQAKKFDWTQSIQQLIKRLENFCQK